MQINNAKTAQEIADLNKNLRRAIAMEPSQDTQTFIDNGADGIVPSGSSDETLFKLAANAKQLNMMEFLAQRLPRAASFTSNPKTNDWLLNLITAGNTDFVLVYLQNASWIRTALNGVVTDESKPVSDYFTKAVLLAIQQQNLRVVKCLLDLGCLSQVEYQTDVNTAITSALETKNAPLLALLLKYNLNIDTNFTESEQGLETPNPMLRLLNSEPSHRHHPAFFVLENYLLANEGLKNYNGDFRKKINTVATLLRIMSMGDDPVLNHQHLQAVIPTAYPTSTSSAFRQAMEALLIYNPSELSKDAEVYLEARKDSKQRNALQDCIVWHLFFGENPLFQCYFYLHVTGKFKVLTEKNTRQLSQNGDDFCAVLSVIRDCDEDTLIEQLKKTLADLAKKPVTVFGMAMFDRPRFSTFPGLLQACMMSSGAEMKGALAHFKLFIEKTELNGDTIDKIKSVIFADTKLVRTPSLLTMET